MKLLINHLYIKIPRVGLIQNYAIKFFEEPIFCKPF